MPAPTEGTDVYVYRLLTPIANKLCGSFVTANMISIFAMLMSIPIVLALHYRCGLLVILFLSIVRQLLDCLDGTVARQCNNMTALGKKLDAGGDAVFLTLIILYILYKIVDAHKSNVFITGIIAISVVFIYAVIMYSLYQAYTSEPTQRSNDDEPQTTYENMVFFLHNNSVLCVIVLTCVVYFIHEQFV